MVESGQSPVPAPMTPPSSFAMASLASEVASLRESVAATDANVAELRSSMDAAMGMLRKVLEMQKQQQQQQQQMPQPLSVQQQTSSQALGTPPPAQHPSPHATPRLQGTPLMQHSPIRSPMYIQMPTSPHGSLVSPMNRRSSVQPTSPHPFDGQELTPTVQTPHRLPKQPSSLFRKAVGNVINNTQSLWVAGREGNAPPRRNKSLKARALATLMSEVSQSQRAQDTPKLGGVGAMGNMLVPVAIEKVRRASGGSYTLQEQASPGGRSTASMSSVTPPSSATSRLDRDHLFPGSPLKPHSSFRRSTQGTPNPLTVRFRTSSAEPHDRNKQKDSVDNGDKGTADRNGSGAGLDKAEVLSRDETSTNQRTPEPEPEAFSAAGCMSITDDADVLLQPRRNVVFSPEDLLGRGSFGDECRTESTSAVPRLSVTADVSGIMDKESSKSSDGAHDAQLSPQEAARMAARKSIHSQTFSGRNNPLDFDDPAVDPAEGSTIYSPNDATRVALDTVVYFDILLEALLASWAFGARHEVPPTWYIILIAILAPILPVFVWFNFRTAIADGWQLLETPELIRGKYLKTFFAYDLITALPWDIALFKLSGTAFRVGLIIRYLKILTIMRLFPVPSMVHERTAYHKLMLNAACWLVLAHTAACSWIYTATIGEQGFASATGEKVVVNPRHQYIASLYWSLATLTSTGYGDISAETSDSRALSLFWMGLGMMIVILTSAKLTEWMVVTDPFALAEMDRKRKLHSFLTRNQIPWNVQKTALRVFPVVLQSMTSDSSIVDELPHFVQEEIRVHVKLKLISKVSMFKHLSRQCQRAIVKVTVNEEYTVDENIVTYGDRGTEMYFLEHGLVEVYTYDDKGREAWIANLKGGSHFGESALMSSNSKRTATVRAVTSCSVYALPKESFDYVCEMFQELVSAIRNEKAGRLRQQGLYTAHMFRKAFMLHVFCTAKPTDSYGRVLWKRGMTRIVEMRYKQKIEQQECQQYSTSRRASSIVPPSPRTRRRRQSQMPIVGTFEETIDVSPPGTPKQEHPIEEDEEFQAALNQFSAFGGGGDDDDKSASVQLSASSNSHPTIDGMRLYTQDSVRLL